MELPKVYFLCRIVDEDFFDQRVIFVKDSSPKEWPLSAFLSSLFFFLNASIMWTAQRAVYLLSLMFCI